MNALIYYNNCMTEEVPCCQGCICHTAYLTYTQNTSCEMPGWKTHRLESRLPGEISTTSDRQIPL